MTVHNCKSGSLNIAQVKMARQRMFQEESYEDCEKQKLQPQDWNIFCLNVEIARQLLMQYTSSTSPLTKPSAHINGGGGGGNGGGNSGGSIHTKMEEPLLCNVGDDEKQAMLKRLKEIKEEVKRVGMLAIPMVAVHLSQYLVQFASITMVGHLGELPLASTAIAVSLCNVTGNSLMLGMASALETLCGQAYGAKQYKKLGTQTYTAILSLNLVCIPISFLWANLAKVLVLIGQDPMISHEAERYAVYLIPSLFAYATLQPLIRFFQAQSMIAPMVLSSIAGLCFHLPLCWMLVFNSELGSVGSAVATSVSMWLTVIFLVLYMKFSSACEKSRSPLSLEIFRGVKEFFRFAIPSAGMVCLEWWSFELLVLLSGLLPNPALETSVLSICLSTISTLYAMPYGIGAAASTRVSNELGAGRPDRARIAVYGTMVIAFIEAIVSSSMLFAARGVFGYLFSNEMAVITYVTKMAPLVCISAILDSVQGALCGIARGSGWQHIAAIVVLGAFYLVGIPMAIWMAFRSKMGGKGLWIGILVGALLQTLLLAVATGFTDWEKQASMARKRFFQEDCEEDCEKELQQQD
ncbi:hypothetical protein V2J09_015067 [Rumex salicifolius]